MTRLPPLRTQRCTHVFTLSTLAVLALIHIAGVRSTVDWGIARLVAIVAIIAILMCRLGSSTAPVHGAGAKPAAGGWGDLYGGSPVIF